MNTADTHLTRLLREITVIASEPGVTDAQAGGRIRAVLYPAHVHEGDGTAEGCPRVLPPGRGHPRIAGHLVSRASELNTRGGGLRQLSRRMASPVEHYSAGHDAGTAWGRALCQGRSSAPSSWPADRAALRQWLSGFSAGVASAASGQDDAEGGRDRCTR